MLGRPLSLKYDPMLVRCLTRLLVLDHPTHLQLFIEFGSEYPFVGVESTLHPLHHL